MDISDAEAMRCCPEQFETVSLWITVAGSGCVDTPAARASIGLLQERAIRRGEMLTEQLQGALNSRIIVEQAKGALAQARGISVDQAFDLLATRRLPSVHGRPSRLLRRIRRATSTQTSVMARKTAMYSCGSSPR